MTNNTFTDFTDWCLRVDTLCRVHLGCGWGDLAGDMAPLHQAYKIGDQPLTFVQWWAEKYGLIWIDGRD